jgi:fucokinase
MVGRNPSPAAELFQQNILVHSRVPIPPDCRVYHSAFLEEPGSLDQKHAVSIGAGTVIEHSILAPGSRIGRGCVVSQFFAGDTPLKLDDNLLFFQVPVHSAPGKPLCVHVLCGVEDDFKGKLDAGQCRFMNGPVQDWLKRHRIATEDLWPGIAAEQRTLWNARLFPATPDWSSIDAALWFQSSKPISASIRSRWKRCPRYSMAMILEQTDPMTLIERREIVAVFLQAGALIDSIQRGEDKPLDSFLSHYTTPGAYRFGIERLCSSGPAFGNAPRGILNHARALWCVSQLLQRPDRPEIYRGQSDFFAAQAFQKIAEASEDSGQKSEVRSQKSEVGSPVLTSDLRPLTSGLNPGIRIEATAPVRLDLAGGWSDTPPYCYEHGGQVVNLAINLHNQPPVRAMVRTIHEPLLILESHDLGTHIELKTLESLQTERGVHDPFALHKVALDMVGLVPRPGSKRGDIQSYLKKLGAGLIVSTECRVPKGSGLGTSSILAATLLAALQELCPRPTSEIQEPNIPHLLNQTLLLEQRLSTGGGWQDQVGGIVGGLKSTTTAPGIPQAPIVEQLPLTDELYDALQQRLVVYYSGQQRLARDILRRVMGRYLAREPAILMLMEELKRSAAALRLALVKGNWPAAGREIARYWELKKQLYPGSTTPTIDVLFLELREHFLAAGLAGAGGGGFAYFFCKDARQAGRLCERLTAQSSRPGSLGSLFQTQINRAGLCVTRKSA